MPISAACPGCGAKFQAPDKLAGRRAKCPKCGAAIAVGGATEPADQTAGANSGEPSIAATCSCGKRFRAKAELAGKRVKCPGCGNALTIPGGQPAPSPSGSSLGSDLDSLLAYYLVESKTIKTTPQISQKDRLETYPCWSPDGRYLYFCSASILWSDRDTVPPENYDQVKYDLVRISYDIDRDEWGELETVLSAEDTGLTILLPRISPDGRWLLFCMADYGSFPVYHEKSDLYMLDLDAIEKNKKAEPRRLQVNSDKSESWHSWSSDSRWIAFSSKRQSGVFTRSYLSYVDREGKAYKPFLLPQKDPTYYDSCLWTYSVPELVTEPVRVKGEKLGRIVRGSQKISVILPVTKATPKPGAVPGQGQTWQERE